MSRGTIISLCDKTGNAVSPWVDAGYRAVLVDPQHFMNSNDVKIERIAGTILDASTRIGDILRSENVVFVCGFPPCTDVAVSGSRWFADKAKADKHFQAKAAIVAEQCRMIALLAGCPGYFENPVSVFSSIFGRPDHIFSPHQYTGYCKDDNYTKTTCLWTFGRFVMPEEFKDTSMGKPDDRIHKAAPGPERANFRSATPKGFAEAVYLSNAPHINGSK